MNVCMYVYIFKYNKYIFCYFAVDVDVVLKKKELEHLKYVVATSAHVNMSETIEPPVAVVHFLCFRRW